MNFIHFIYISLRATIKLSLYPLLQGPQQEGLQRPHTGSLLRADRQGWGGGYVGGGGVCFINITLMAELDLSQHSLNTSSSKQKFSFPKTTRFGSRQRALCENIYEVPSTRSNRSTSFGLGGKDIGIRQDKSIPPIGTYDLASDFARDPAKGFSFGSGREEMALGGPLKDSKILSFIPGPGNYDSNKSTLDEKGPSLKPRLPDLSQKHLLKNPGPGTYAFEEIGGRMYYATSKFRNHTNHKITPGSRLSAIGKRTTLDVGPGSYTIDVEDLNARGRYSLSNHENSKTRIFDKTPRPELLYKHMVHTPGPGQYGVFSSFG